MLDNENHERDCLIKSSISRLIQKQLFNNVLEIEGILAKTYDKKDVILYICSLFEKQRG